MMKIFFTAAALFILGLALALAHQGCSRRTENRSGGAEPFGTYRRAVRAADSAAAKAGRRAGAADSVATEDR